MQCVTSYLSEEPGLDECAAGQHGGRQLGASAEVLLILGEGEDVAIADDRQWGCSPGTAANVLPVRKPGVPGSTGENSFSQSALIL